MCVYIVYVYCDTTMRGGSKEEEGGGYMQALLTYPAFDVRMVPQCLCFDSNSSLCEKRKKKEDNRLDYRTMVNNFYQRVP